MKHVSPLRLIRRALLLCILLVSFTTQIMGQDYWDRVPELTTQCYSEQDPFRNTVDELRFEIKDKIEAIKQADSEKANNISQEELMAAAMRFQSMTPDEIVKFQTEMAEMTTAQADFFEKVTAIENRYNELEAEFRGQFSKRLGLSIKKPASCPMVKAPLWAIDKGEELMTKYGQEYESICQTYITSADSKFRNRLKDYQKFLIEDEVPFSEMMLKMQSMQYGLTPDASVAALSAVERYLDKSSSISALSRPYPQRS